MVKVAFFQKDQLGIVSLDGNGRKWVKNGLFWPKIDFYSECGVIINHFNNFIPSCIEILGSPVVIAFRSKIPWFCEFEVI